MGTCDVLRCSSRASLAMRVTPPGRAIVIARLCHDHHEAIEGGARWLGDWGAGFEEGSATLVMDGDLPPLVKTYTCTHGHLSDRGQTEVVNLELVHSDGTVSHVEFELDPVAGRSLSIWLGGRGPSQ